MSSECADSLETMIIWSSTTSGYPKVVLKFTRMTCEATAVTALVLGLARFRIKVTQNRRLGRTF
uniref:WGS project CBMI000000000 data, contig CS3069_c000731 n=1 Tax=Fusarium clavum TaxID=2594811 RepID=A0A090N5C1_9HYPO|nr:unnamed protein product [Fusarium clavum]